jgi:hypothetical protein
MADSPDAPADSNLATLAAAASAVGTAETGASSLEEDANAPSVEPETSAPSVDEGDVESSVEAPTSAPSVDDDDVEPSTVRAAEESASEEFAAAEEPNTSVDELGAVTAGLAADLPTDDAAEEDPAEARNDENGAEEDAAPDSEPPPESEPEPDELA